MQLMQPAQLPEIKVARPLQAYFAGQEMAQQEKMQKQQMQLQQMQMQEQQMKLQEYEQDAPQREQQKKFDAMGKRLQMDEGFNKVAMEVMSKLDPNSPTFNKDSAEAMVAFERYIGELTGDHEETSRYMKYVAAKGGFSPEAVKEARIRMGIDKPPELKSEIKDGQQIIHSTAGAVAQDIPGYKKEPEEKIVNGQVLTKIDGQWVAKDIPGAKGSVPQTTVNVNTGDNLKNVAEKKANEVYGGKIGENVNKRFSMAEEAYNQNAQLDTVALALADGARTGFGEEVLLNIRSLAQTIGIDVGDLGPEELIRKISNEMALRLRNPDSGLGLTGNTSNKDLDFLKASVIGLSRTEGGNRLIIEMMRKYNKMKIDIAQKQDELIAANDGNIPRDIDRQMLKFANEYEMFSADERKQIEGFLGGGKTVGGDKPAAGPSTADEYLKSIGVQ
jgi:hypothetical protein